MLTPQSGESSPIRENVPPVPRAPQKDRLTVGQQYRLCHTAKGLTSFLPPHNVFLGQLLQTLPCLQPRMVDVYLILYVAVQLHNGSALIISLLPSLCLFSPFHVINELKWGLSIKQRWSIGVSLPQSPKLLTVVSWPHIHQLTHTVTHTQTHTYRQQTDKHSISGKAYKATKAAYSHQTQLKLWDYCCCLCMCVCVHGCVFGCSSSQSVYWNCDYLHPRNGHLAKLYEKEHQRDIMSNVHFHTIKHRG